MFPAAGRVLTITTVAMALAGAVGASIPAAAAAIPTSARGGATLQPQTQADLMSSLRSEAYDRALYTLFAEQAQQQRLRGVARLFQRTAQAELRQGFMPAAALSGLLGTPAADLSSATSAQGKHATRMYSRFARQAARDGDSDAAAVFTQIARDEKARQAAFSSALAVVKGGHGTVPAAPKVTPATISTGSIHILSLRTLAHLSTAMRDAAFASAEYAGVAADAKAGGQRALAQLLTGDAAVELKEHFAAEAALAGTVCQAQCNLTAAILGARIQSWDTYPVYARAASAAGDRSAAGLFRHDAAAANSDAFAFQQTLDNLRAP